MPAGEPLPHGIDFDEVAAAGSAPPHTPSLDGQLDFSSPDNSALIGAL